MERKRAASPDELGVNKKPKQDSFDGLGCKRASSPDELGVNKKPKQDSFDGLGCKRASSPDELGVNKKPKQVSFNLPGCNRASSPGAMGVGKEPKPDSFNGPGCKRASSPEEMDDNKKPKQLSFNDPGCIRASSPDAMGVGKKPKQVSFNLPGCKRASSPEEVEDNKKPKQVSFSDSGCKRASSPDAMGVGKKPTPDNFNGPCCKRASSPEEMEDNQKPKQVSFNLPGCKRASSPEEMEDIKKPKQVSFNLPGCKRASSPEEMEDNKKSKQVSFNLRGCKRASSPEEMGDNKKPKQVSFNLPGCKRASSPEEMEDNKKPKQLSFSDSGCKRASSPEEMEDIQKPKQDNFNDPGCKKTPSTVIESMESLDGFDRNQSRVNSISQEVDERTTQSIVSISHSDEGEITEDEPSLEYMDVSQSPIYYRVLGRYEEEEADYLTRRSVFERLGTPEFGYQKSESSFEAPEDSESDSENGVEESFFWDSFDGVGNLPSKNVPNLKSEVVIFGHLLHDLVRVRPKHVIKLCIYDDDNADLMISRRHAEKVVKYINKRIRRWKRSKLASAPRFYDARWDSGELVLYAEDLNSFRWLKTILVKNRYDYHLWENHKIRLVTYFKSRRAYMFIEDKSLTFRRLPSRIKMQNPGLLTKSWRVIYSCVCRSGSFFVFSVREDDFDILEKKQFQIVYGKEKIPIVFDFMTVAKGLLLKRVNEEFEKRH